jgi:PAS domain S-box-containing protein
MMTESDTLKNPLPFPRISAWIPLLAFVLIIFLVSAAGYAISEQYKKSIKNEEIQNLGAIADLKVTQISAWRKAHRKRAEMFLNSSLLPGQVDLWLREGAPANERKQKILELLAGTQQAHDYKSVSLLDTEGATRISTNDRYTAGAEEKRLAIQAMRSQRTIFSDFHRGGNDGNQVRISSVAPLRVADKKNGTRIVGVLLFEIDPGTFLLPLIQSWPTKHLSAETILARRDGDDILFLNELRHQKGTAHSLRIPLARTQVPIVMAALGQMHVTEGVDYRGIPVVAALRNVPDTPWMMSAEIDKAELFAPIKTLQRWVTGLAFAFTLLGGGMVFFWFKEYQARHDTAVIAQHFEYLTRHSNDIVVLVDTQGRIIKTNDQAALVYGYTKEQLKSKRLGDLLAPGIDLSSRLAEIEKNVEIRFESEHIRKDGTRFPVECHVLAIMIDGVRYYQGILCDITQRKQAEDQLRRQKNFILQVIDTDPNLIFVKDNEGKFLLVNQAMAAFHGMSPLELIGRNDTELCWNKTEFESDSKVDREVIATRLPVTYITHCLDKERWHLVTKTPMVQPDGKVNVLGIAIDITERQIAEKKLNASYRELEQLATHLEIVREEEQKRIARELHDEMGGTLAALNIKVALLAVQPPAEMAEFQTEVSCMAELVNAGIQSMRRTVAALRPSLLEEVGLAFAIERHVEEFRKNTGIECDLRLPEEVPILDGNQSTAIFRIIQESLTNAAKYAEASKISIVLSEWEKSWVLTVKDNGKGFDQKLLKEKSFGLLGIRERAAMIGGKAQITSAVDKGTTVRVSLPRAA